MANKQIRGITIEIDGDVTKLDKALTKMDRSLSETTKNLKDVERLLKIDPGNLELLDQKQRLLAQSVEKTTEKYDLLKKTLEESTASNVNYEKWTKAQASLQGELTKTENALKSLVEQKEKLGDLGFSADTASMQDIQEQIDKTTQKAEALKQKMSDTYEELGRPISVDQYDALQRELVETKDEMEKAEKAAAKFNPSLARLSGVMDEVSNKAAKVAENTKLLSAAAAGVSAALVGSAVKAGQYADELNTISKQSGFSTETIQSWQYAADRIDVDADTIINAATRMTKNIASSSSDVQEAWQRLGVSLTDNVSGELRSVEDIFNDTIAALSQIENETERDIVAMTIFGKTSNELAGIIDDGGAALRAYGEEARRNNLILSGEALDAANAFNDGLDSIKAKAEATFMSAGAALAENLLPTLERLVEIVGRVLNWFAQLDGGTLRVITTIAMLVALISPIAKLISNITGAISGITSVASLFTSTAGNQVYLTFAKWALIILAVVAAITALLAVIAELQGKGEGLRQTFASMNYRNDGTLRSSVPGFASGGVIEPNNPMLAVVGDNRTEREVIAPRSELVDAAREAIRAEGGTNGGQLVGVVRFTGTDQEIVRALGPKLQLLWSDTGLSI